LIRISPANPTEADEISVEFLSGCRSWDNNQFVINGNQVDYSVDYSDCVILPPPESFAAYSIGYFSAGNYLLELLIFNVGTNQVDTVVLPFSVGIGPVAVPLTVHTYLLLILLIALLTCLHLRMVRKAESPIS